ncbi:MAG: peroxiredoxin [Pseudomonadota bacterium]
MPLSVGDALPDATLLRIGDNGPEQVALAAHVAGRKVAIFGMPGAFTGVCSGTHMPNLIANAGALRDKGIDEVIVVTVNDPFVNEAWDKSTGAGAAGITVLADPASEFTKATGLTLDAPPVGFYARSQRYGLMAEDGVVKVLNTGDAPGDMALSSADALLEKI